MLYVLLYCPDIDSNNNKGTILYYIETSFELLAACHLFDVHLGMSKFDQVAGIIVGEIDHHFLCHEMHA